MVTHFERLGRDGRVADAVECLIRTTRREFPICDGDGRLEGARSRDAVIRALKERGPDTPVVEVMDTDVPELRSATAATWRTPPACCRRRTAGGGGRAGPADTRTPRPQA